MATEQQTNGTDAGIATKVDASATSSDYKPFSYATIIQDLNRFRATARNDVNLFDMPGQVYFRVLFHFNNDSDVVIGAPGTEGEPYGKDEFNSYNGLIGPSWLNFGDPLIKSINTNSMTTQGLNQLWAHSTAFNYFMLNNEIQRAVNTKKFVELLSSISANSPWYFQNIKGLDTAIERQVANGDFMFKDERDKITIECLDDSYDQRIGTLLDLYRSIVWSWETKRIMLPANLRKFDMTIIAFQMPIEGVHMVRRKQFTSTNSILPLQRTGRYPMSDTEVRGTGAAKSLDVLAVSDKGFTVMYDGDPANQAPVASYKAWEFHGCEIDYNSSKSGWSEISNAEGSVPKYSIDIFFDDMFEVRFNEFLGQHITDLMGDNAPIIIDKNSNPDSVFFELQNKLALELERNANLEGDAKTDSNNKIAELRNNIRIVQTAAAASYELPDANYVVEVKDTTTPISTQSPLNGRNIFNGKPSRGSGIIDQIIGHGQAWLETKLKKVYLGNMNGLSLSKVRQQVETAIDGDLFATAANVANYVRGNYKGGNGQLGENIFPAPTGSDSDRIISLGNIFKANTALNS